MNCAIGHLVTTLNIYYLTLPYFGPIKALVLNFENNNIIINDLNGVIRAPSSVCPQKYRDDPRWRNVTSS